jgi:hypothetical protein
MLATELLFVYVYCLIDDAIKTGALAIPPRRGPVPRCGDAELITIARVTTWLPGGRDAAHAEWFYGFRLAIKTQVRQVVPAVHPHDLAELADRRPVGLPGEIVGTGTWDPLVAEETWRAVRGILEDPARKPPRGVRILLGGRCARAGT